VSPDTERLRNVADCINRALKAKWGCPDRDTESSKRLTGRRLFGRARV
jgi:hypothetical protein